MLRFVALFLFTLWSLGVQGKKPPLDSLILSLDTLQGEAKAICLIDIAQGYWYKQPDSAIFYAELAQEYCKGQGFTEREGFAFNALGYAYYLKGLYVPALDYLFQAKRIFEAAQYPVGTSIALNNIGSVYLAQEDNRLAIQYFSAYLSSARERGSLKDEGTATLNLGVAYSRIKKFDSAYFFYRENLKISRKTNNSFQVGIALNNIADVFLDQENYDSAYVYYQQSLEIAEKIKDYEGVLLTEKGSARALLGQKQAARALPRAKRSLKLAQQYGFQSHEMLSHKLLAEIYAARGNFQEAYQSHRAFKTLQDTLFNAKNTQKLTRLESAFELEKQQSQIESLRKDKALLEKDKKIQQLNNRNLMVALSLLALLFAVGGWGYFKDRQKNRLLAQKNQEVETKNAELNQQQEEIITQRDAIEAQNKELSVRNQQVMSSINYAERIQQSLLPGLETVRKHFPDAFVFYRPRDVVSGDFYWLYEQNGILTFALMDCTGHGVPGAMMSMMGIQMLNELKALEQPPTPARIMQHLNSSLRQAFGHSAQKDSMDGAVCQLSADRKTLTFAGSHTTLFVGQPTGGLLQLQGDRKSLGSVTADFSFSEHELPVEPETMIYLSSDGFQDQFGGTKNRKMLRKGLAATLRAASQKPLPAQEQFIIHTFDAWKGKEPQIDDVLLWGIRVGNRV